MSKKVEGLRLRSCCISLLVFGFVLLSDGIGIAEGFRTLHNFGGVDGSGPSGPLSLLGQMLYGVTDAGGTFGKGTIFRINADGTGFTNLYHFMGANDGSSPQGGLVISGENLYGFALDGTIFRLNTDGTGFTNLYKIPTTAIDSDPRHAGLIVSSNTLFGVAAFAGSSGSGTVFAINIDGTGFTNLHDFGPLNYQSPLLTNADGAYPFGALALSGNTLYGTASAGGTFQSGAVFSLQTDGTGFKILHQFSQESAEGYNDDGAYPKAAITLINGRLYGTTSSGGWNSGTVFRLNSDGTDFTTLFKFDRSGVLLGPPYIWSNVTGARPNSLLSSGDTLISTCYQAGGWGIGNIFSLKADGMRNTVLHNFVLQAGQSFTYTNTDGEQPNALTLADQTVYGTTCSGGSSGLGTVFSFSLDFSITISQTAGKTVVSWPSDPPYFQLQYSTDLSSTNWTLIPGTTPTVNGLRSFTNTVPTTRQFFRLSP